MGRTGGRGDIRRILGGHTVSKREASPEGNSRKEVEGVMMENHAPFLIALAAILIAIVLSVVIVTHHYRVIRMAELGYCEVTTQGSENLVWQKCK